MNEFIIGDGWWLDHGCKLRSCCGGSSGDETRTKEDARLLFLDYRLRRLHNLNGSPRINKNRPFVKTFALELSRGKGKRMKRWEDDLVVLVQPLIDDVVPDMFRNHLIDGLMRSHTKAYGC